MAELPFGESIVDWQLSTAPSAIMIRGAFPLVYAVSNVQLDSARRQNWQGWTPSHLILRLYNISLGVSKSTTVDYNYFLHLSHARVTLALSALRFRFLDTW